MGVGPRPFSFFNKTVLPSDKRNMLHFLKEMAEQILMRYQVKGRAGIVAQSDKRRSQKGNRSKKLCGAEFDSRSLCLSDHVCEIPTCD